MLGKTQFKRYITGILRITIFSIIIKITNRYFFIFVSKKFAQKYDFFEIYASVLMTKYTKYVA